MYFPAVSFVGPNNVMMSALVAQKMINLNPIPSELTFITYDVELLKNFHSRTLNVKFMEIKYLQDDYLGKVLNFNVERHLNNRLGWLSRQWVQLHLDILFPKAEYILTCDSDLVVNRPLDLFSNGRTNYFVETEPYYEPYFITMKQVLPKLKKFLPQGDSFNSEIMVLVTSQLKKLREEMNIPHQEWYDLCHKNMPKGGCSAFSEYETIGTWMINNASDMINLLKSDTYDKNNKFGDVVMKHKLSDLLKHQSVIPLRSVVDSDISWFE